MHARLKLAGALALTLATIRAASAAPATNAPARHDFDVDAEGFIRNWLGLPPIVLNVNVSGHNEASQKPVFDKDFFQNQKEATPIEGSKVVVDGKELTWSAVQTESFVWDFGSAENALALGVTYVMCTQEIAGVVLSIGSDDSSMWRLNGVEVIRFYGGRGVGQDQNQSSPLTLKRGLNVLSLAVINGGGGFGACARFRDQDGNPVTSLKIAPTPRRTPQIADAGVSNVTAKTATVCGNLASVGTAPTALLVYHGPNDGETNRSAWAKAVRLPAPLEAGPHDITFSHSASGAIWYYRFCATNEFGETWADSSGSFMVGAVGVRATRRESTEEKPAAFVLSRPATITNGAIRVNLTFSGGVNGVNFDWIENPATIPAGESELSLVVVPSADWRGDSRPKLITLTVAPGGYLVGTNSSASILSRP